MNDALIERVKVHEGLRLKPYRCTAGKLSVGYGRNLDDRGISEEEAEAMLRRDLLEAEKSAEKWIRFPVAWIRLNDERQGVIAELAFWLGRGGLGKFKRFRSAIVECRFDAAADELLFVDPGDSPLVPSILHTQAPARTERLAEIIRKGTL